MSKHTYADGISDVDALVCLNATSLENKSPEQAMAHFREHLRDRLPNTEISQGRLAVTVKFADGHGRSSVIAPDRFAKKLTSVNKTQSGHVVPLIKLYKVLNESLPKPAQLSGYHIESLAIEAFENYTSK